MYYIGLMSGTSMDAIDVVVADLDDKSATVLAYQQFPIPEKIQLRVRAVNSSSSIDTITELDVILAGLFADAVCGLLNSSGLKAEALAGAVTRIARVDTLRLRILQADGDAQLGPGLENPEACYLQAEVLLVGLVDQAAEYRVLKNFPPVLILDTRCIHTGIVSLEPVIRDLRVRPLKIGPHGGAAGQEQHSGYRRHRDYKCS